MPSLACSERYQRAALRMAVAQVCQTLGWQSASSSALDVLVDVAQNHLMQMARLTARYANQFERTLSNLDDLGLALRDLGVSVTELEEYASVAEWPAFPRPVPPLPAARPTNLSFLKPGSQEIVTRPIHVYEHLPPMHPDTAEEDAPDVPAAESPGGRTATASGTSPALKRPGDTPLSGEAKRGRYAPEEEGRPMREILSVMMTTSGFISPALEGKLPETRLPEPLDDYGEDYRNVKTRKQRADTYRRLSERESERRARNRDRWGRSVEDDDHDLFDIIDVKVEEEEASAGSSPEKLPIVKETAKLKPFKKHHKASEVVVKTEPPEPPVLSSPKVKQEEKSVTKGKVKSKPAEGKSSKLSIFKKIAKGKQEKASALIPAEKPPVPTTLPPVKKKVKKKPPKVLGPELFKVEKPAKTVAAKNVAAKSVAGKSVAAKSVAAKSVAAKSVAAKSVAAKTVEAPSVKTEPTSSKPTSKSSEKVTKQAERSAGKPAEKPTKAAMKPVAEAKPARQPRSPSPPVVSTSSITPPGTPGTPRAPEPRRKPSEISLSELSPRSYDSGTPDRPRTPELPLSRRESPPPPPDPAELLNNPLIPRFPFPFSAPGVEGSVPAPPFPGLPGLRPPPSLFLGGGSSSGAPSAEERTSARGGSSGPAAARPLDPRRSPGDDSDGSRSPTPDPSTMTPLKRLEMEERAEKKKEKEHKKSKKDKKEKKKKDKKDKEKKEMKTEKKEVKMEKKEKKKKEEKEKQPAKETRDDAVPKLTLRLGSHDSSKSRSPSPEPPPPPKVFIKPVREQPPPAPPPPPPARARKEKKKAAEPPPPPPAQLKPPKKEKEKKKSPQPKAKKTTAAPKQAPAAVIAETVGSFLDNEGNRIWICPECGRQDDGSPMIGCDQCDDWYHWVCVGIQVPPANSEDWYCPRCIGKMQDNVKQKGRGRGRKK